MRPLGLVGGMVYDGTVGKKASVKGGAIELGLSFFMLSERIKYLILLRNMNMRRFLINSEVNGYEIETLCITSNQETSDAMIVVHGIGK